MGFIFLGERLIILHAQAAGVNHDPVAFLLLHLAERFLDSPQQHFNERLVMPEHRYATIRRDLPDFESKSAGARVIGGELVLTESSAAILDRTSEDLAAINRQTYSRAFQCLSGTAS